MPCIHYSVQFRKNRWATIWALINSGSEVNAITPKKLGLRTRKTDIGAQKIDGSLLETYEMVIAAFQVKDKLSRAQFFQEAFLLADTSMEVALGILFLTFSNADIQFAWRKITWRSYIAKEALLTTWRVELIDKKKMAKAVLDENIKVFVMYGSSLSLGSKMMLHPVWEA